VEVIWVLALGRKEKIRRQRCSSFEKKISEWSEMKLKRTYGGFHLEDPQKGEEKREMKKKKAVGRIASRKAIGLCVPRTADASSRTTLTEKHR